MSKFIPHDYQQIGIDHVLKNKEAGLFLEMGLGKTITSLTAVEELINDRFDVHKVLIVGPKYVVKHTWPDEIDKWEHLNLTYSVVLGSQEARRRALKKEADIYLINRENLVWLLEEVQGKTFDWEFDMLIIDELSSFKNPSAKRFKALRKMRPLFKRAVGLTGTPTPNGLVELWPQMYLLDRGKRLGKAVTHFRNKYFYPAYTDPRTGIVYEYRVRDKRAEDEIYDLISDIVISMKTVDYLTLPDRVDTKQYVELSRKEREQYETLEKDFILEVVEDGVGGDLDIVADNSAALSNKLLQLANGSVYDDEGDSVFFHKKKLEALEQIVESNEGKPILVFYSYKHDLDLIRRKYPQAKTIKDGENIVKEWNQGKISMLLAHPASAGHGLNLQDGGNIIAWYGLPWSLELYQQANARLHRQGQKETTYIHHIMARDTIDEEVYEALQQKEKGQDAVFEAIKKRLAFYSED